MILKDKVIGYGEGIQRGHHFSGVTFTVCNRTKFIDCIFVGCRFENNLFVSFKNCNIDKTCTYGKE